MLMSSKMTVPWGSSLTSVATSLPCSQKEIVSYIYTHCGRSEKILMWTYPRDFQRLDAYISVLDGKLNVVSSLQSLQITLELAVVKEDLLHHIGPFDESKSLLKDDT